MLLNFSKKELINKVLMSTDLSELVTTSPESDERREKTDLFIKKFEESIISEFGDNQMSLRARVTLRGIFFLYKVVTEEEIFNKFLSKETLTGERNFLELEIMEGNQVVMTLDDFQQNKINNTIYLKKGGDCLFNLRFSN